MTGPVWLWDLCPGAAMLHILARNGRTLCGRRTLGDGTPTTPGDGNEPNRCTVCTRRARWAR